MFTIECLKCGEILKTKDAVRAATFNNDHAHMHRLEACIHGPGCDERSHGLDCNEVFYGGQREALEAGQMTGSHFEEWKAEKLKNPAIREAYEAAKAERDQPKNVVELRPARPFHERILTDHLRAVADGFAAFLTAPLRAYDEAHEIDTEGETDG